MKAERHGEKLPSGYSEHKVSEVETMKQQHVRWIQEELAEKFSEELKVGLERLNVKQMKELLQHIQAFKNRF